MRRTCSSVFLFGLLLLGAGRAAEPDAIYFNGQVITLDSNNRVAEAMALDKDRILAVGSAAELRQLATPRTALHDLQGKTIVPGFFAAHDHFPGAGAIGLTTVDLNSPPIGGIKNMPELVQALKQKAATTPAGQWLRGRGYDDTLLAEKRHPTRADLDQVSTTHPIWITHISGHLGVANSLALERAKIDRHTAQPSGGRIQLDPQTGEPNGVLEESLGLVTRLIPAPSAEEQIRIIQAAVPLYARQGVTTAVIAGGNVQSLDNLIAAAKLGMLKFRIVTMTFQDVLENSRAAIAKLDSPLLSTGAVKLMQDGSIQGYTGYLSQPYYKLGSREANYRGYALRSRESLFKQINDLHRAGQQIAVHGNGDQAIDDIIDAYEQAQKDFPRADARHRIEHCQTARDDQLDRMTKLGITPSFFVGHVYYWGDRHQEIFLGTERAARISPLASALKRNIRFTVHDDTPVTPVNPWQLVWVAANRQTHGGRILGAEQRIGVEQALRAVTSEAAWQNRLEASRGTLEPGKLADFVILDGNPLTTKPADLRQIKIVETVVGGTTIYRLDDQK